MITEEKAIALKSLLESEEFCKKLEHADTFEYVQNIFREHGVKITEDEFNEICDAFEKSYDGELSEDQLENVSGGVVTTFILFCGLVIVASVLLAIGIRNYKRGQQKSRNRY